MKNETKRMFLIKIAYWLGIGADATWAAGLLFTPVFGLLVGNSAFSPDFQTRQVMLVAGLLMAGWTILLLWAVRNPFERRFVILLTAFLVIGLLIVSLKGYMAGNTILLWVLIKCALLFVAMITSYFLAGETYRPNIEVRHVG